jgi:uncharacterized protein (DUF305 family)
MLAAGQRYASGDREHAALLLVGAAIGMVITTSTRGDTSLPAADSVEVGFAHDMQVHHLQAVAMAALARARSTDPAVKTLAVAIDGTRVPRSA